MVENEACTTGFGTQPGAVDGGGRLLMDLGRRALGILIMTLGGSGPALAQAGAEAATSLGAGLTLRDARQHVDDSPDARTPVLATKRGWWDTHEWWGLAGAEKRFDVGLGLVPRLGSQATGEAYPIGGPMDVGPGLRWRSAAGTLTAVYGVDPTGLSRGESIQFSFSRPVISEQGFRLLAFVGARWQSGRGDRMLADAGERWQQPVEVRPLYSSGAATNVGFGLDSYYQLTKSSAIMLGASGLRLGGAPADGALYTNRWQAILYGGYAIRF